MNKFPSAPVSEHSRASRVLCLLQICLCPPHLKPFDSSKPASQQVRALPSSFRMRSWLGPVCCVQNNLGVGINMYLISSPCRAVSSQLNYKSSYFVG